jgi:hypothetical protein
MGEQAPKVAALLRSSTLTLHEDVSAAAKPSVAIHARNERDAAGAGQASTDCAPTCSPLGPGLARDGGDSDGVSSGGPQVLSPEAERRAAAKAAMQREHMRTQAAMAAARGEHQTAHSQHKQRIPRSAARNATTPATQQKVWPKKKSRSPALAQAELLPMNKCIGARAPSPVPPYTEDGLRRWLSQLSTPELRRRAREAGVLPRGTARGAGAVPDVIEKMVEHMLPLSTRMRNPSGERRQQERRAAAINHQPTRGPSQRASAVRQQSVAMRQEKEDLNVADEFQPVKRVLWDALHHQTRTLYGQRINSIRSFFDAIDQDGSQSVNVSELHAAMVRTHKPCLLS